MADEIGFDIARQPDVPGISFNRYLVFEDSAGFCRAIDFLTDPLFF